MKVTRVGFDIAKRVFQVHGVDENGKVKARKTLAREKVLEYFAQLPACLIGMEACGGAHYWGRELSKLGHTVKLMAAQFVIPYRKRGKNDANDAEAICEAVGRPNMHFVAIKSEEQQSVLMVHRARTLVVANRTAQVNQIRGLLGEFGLVVAKGVARLRRELPGILEDAENGLPVLAREVLAGLLEQFHEFRGDRTADGNRAGGQYGRPTRLQERAKLRRLTRDHPAPALERRHRSTGPDHAPGGSLRAHALGTRSARVFEGRRQKDRWEKRLGAAAQGASTHQRCRCRARG